MKKETGKHIKIPEKTWNRLKKIATKNLRGSVADQATLMLNAACDVEEKTRNNPQ